MPRHLTTFVLGIFRDKEIPLPPSIIWGKKLDDNDEGLKKFLMPRDSDYPYDIIDLDQEMADVFEN